MANNKTSGTPPMNTPSRDPMMTGEQTTSQTGRNMAARVGEKVEHASSRVGDSLSSGSDVIRRGAENVAHRLDEAGRYLRESDARSIGSDITNVIRNHPKAAIGVGLGIGFLLGRMLSR